MFTQESIKARPTLAHKAVDVIPAVGAVPAGLAGALVDLGLTAAPLETWAALAGETAHIVHAGAAVQARV